MKIKHKLILLFIGISLIFSGCTIPFTDKVVFLPFLEKRPDEVIPLMLDKMLNSQAYGFFTEADLNIRIEPDKLTGERQSKINKIAKYFMPNTPIVLGADIESSKFMTVPAFILGRPLLAREPVDLGFKISSSGYYEAKDIDNIKAKNYHQINMAVDGTALEFDLETISAGEKNYYRVAKTPHYYSEIFADLDDKWLLTDPNAKNLNKMYQYEDDRPIMPSEIPPAEEIKNFLDKNDNILRNFILLAREKNIFKKTERLPDELINGRKAYRYVMEVDRTGLSELITELYEGMYEKQSGFEALRAREEARKSIEAGVYGMEPFNLEVLIDKKEFYLHKYSLDIGLDFKTQGFSIAGKIGTVFDFDKVQLIEEPANSYYFDDAYYEFIVAPALEVGTKKRDIQRISDIAIIEKKLEMYFLENNKYPDDLVFAFENTENSVPVNPLPSDKSCHEEFEYSYLVKNNGEAYELSYCLGLGTDSIPAGVNKLISGNIQMPSVTTSVLYDMDGDGLSDYEETQFKTDPLKKDTDSDGLWDYEEIVIYETDPLNPDTDGDGFLDGEEVANWYDPNSVDGKLDPYETAAGTLRKTYEELYSGNKDYYSEKIFMSGELASFVSSELNMDMNGFMEKLKNSITSRGAELKMVNFTLKEKIDDDNFRFEFFENYRPLPNSYVPEPLKRSAHMTNDGGVWKFDIFRDLKMLKNDNKHWPLVLETFK